MPWEKGHKPHPNAGRKGYEIEKAQLDKMRRILNKDMAIAEKFQNSKELSPLEKEKLIILQARILKYADKLHASRTTQEHSGEVEIPISILDKIVKKK